MVDVAGRPILCVGGGPVAARKTALFIKEAALVTVISPTLDAAFPQPVNHRVGEYVRGMVQDVQPYLAIAATGVRAVDDAVANDAESCGVFCLRIDGRGDTAMPWRITDAGVTVTVSTGVPSLTRMISERLSAALDPSWGPAATRLAELRRSERLRETLSPLPQEERRRRWQMASDAAIDGASRSQLLAVLTHGVPHTTPQPPP